MAHPPRGLPLIHLISSVDHPWLLFGVVSCLRIKGQLWQQWGGWDWRGRWWGAECVPRILNHSMSGIFTASHHIAHWTFWCHGFSHTSYHILSPSSSYFLHGKDTSAQHSSTCFQMLHCTTSSNTPSHQAWNKGCHLCLMCSSCTWHHTSCTHPAWYCASEGIWRRGGNRAPTWW